MTGDRLEIILLCIRYVIFFQWFSKKIGGDRIDFLQVPAQKSHLCHQPNKMASNSLTQFDNRFSVAVKMYLSYSRTFYCYCHLLKTAVFDTSVKSKRSWSKSVFDNRSFINAKSVFSLVESSIFLHPCVCLQTGLWPEPTAAARYRDWWPQGHWHPSDGWETPAPWAPLPCQIHRTSSWRYWRFHQRGEVALYNHQTKYCLK